MNDFKAAGGICEGSLGDKFLYTNVFPTTDVCDVDVEFFGLPVINNGICSEATENALIQEDCFISIIRQPSYVYYSVFQLLRDTCKENVYATWRNFMSDTIGQPIGFQLEPPNRFKRRKRKNKDINIGEVSLNLMLYQKVLI